ncbi:MAG: 2-dehydro-3-deoxy-6-phosphogalactonate aldolase [Comamonas sp.]
MHSFTPTPDFLRGLVAILRGLTPDESVTVGQALYETGFRLIEVPMNSPEPLQSIARLRAALPADCRIGAGTVLSTAVVDAVRAAGGDLVVMPHADVAVIAHAHAAGMLCVPGVATPTEAFAALAAGAAALKLFPAEQLGPAVLKAWRAVIPAEIGLLPVGGITPANMAAYLQAGASGFGLGSALFKPGQGVAQIREQALAFQQRWAELAAGR